MRSWLLALLLLSSACHKACDVNATREMPKLPPPPHVPLPPALQIAVEIDGHPAPVIDAQRLSSLKPDFEDPEHRAWKLQTLLGPDAARPGAVAAITGAEGLTVLFRRPASTEAPQPVLAESRRGGIVAAMLTPENPFPPYHGQGRRLSRPGDPLPRIGGVTSIRLYVEPVALDSPP